MKISARRALLLLSLIAAIIGVYSRAWAGSQFYFTIERSFSSDESAEVRLDYTKSAEPITLRVLKPKDLPRFLEGQLNLSRAYEEPLASINPGHFVLTGLNKVNSPLYALRNFLSEDFRNSFGGDDFNHALYEPNPVSQLVSPPLSIVQGPPAGFDVVREIYLDLQKGGAEAEHSLWFWYGEDESYKIRNIRLDPLPDGVYLLQGLQGKVEAQALLQVSSLAVQVKQSTSQLLVRAMDRKLSPVAGASVSFRDSRGKWRKIDAPTDASGEVNFHNPEGVLEGKLVVRVEASGGRQALTDTDFLPASEVSNSMFIVTDRPIFKPGEEFFFKGTLRLLDNGSLRVPSVADKNATVTLLKTDGGETGLSASLPLTDFGTFSGSFQLPDYQSPGLYRLVATVDGKPYGGEFRVKDYVKPKFYIELSDKTGQIVPGQKLLFHLRAKNFSGSVPERVKYETFIYRKKFEAPQFVLESGGGLETGHDYFGDIRSASALSQPQRIFSSAEARAAANGKENGADIGNTWDTAPELDEKGEAIVEIDVPAPAKPEPPQEWTYTLVVRAQDLSGSSAVLSENFYATLSEVIPSVRFAQTVTESGAKEAAFAVRTTFPGGDPASDVSGQVDLTLETPVGTKNLSAVQFKTDSSGMARLKVPGPLAAGRLVAVAQVRTLGERQLAYPGKSEPAQLIVGADAGGAVIANRELELIPSTSILSPGEKTKVLALLPEKWGVSEGGTVWQTMAGTSIYATQSRAVKGRSVWLDVEAKPEYGTGFFHTVTVPIENGKYSEQTVGFRIVPDNKRLTVRVLPESDTSEPLKDFTVNFEVKDSQGNPAAKTELSVNIVDRAVYAVQSEFRPEILEFFYPLPRLNVGTFYSDELQGYGYADEIKKPNFSLAAIKSRSQPAKRSLRDTAGWFPHVVTNDQGVASVTAHMPANVTEWIVTAIAADKDGRVGEGRGKFRSAVEVNVDAQLPMFLRTGDEAQGAIRTENQRDTAAALELSPSVTGDVKLEGIDPSKNLSLAPKANETLPLTLRAGETTAAGLLTIGVNSAPDVKSGGAREFDVPLLASKMEQTFPGKWNPADSKVSFAVPKTGEASKAVFTVTSGLLGSALGAARELVSYPYGCTEQLTHTTIPNLVLLDLLQKAGIEGKDLGAFQFADAYQRARRLAETGVQKISFNQKADGSFKLWAGEQEGSFPLTLIVLPALQLAANLEVPGASKAMTSARAWVGDQISGDQTTISGGLGGYELATLAELNFLYQLRDRLVEYVKETAADANAPLEQVLSALRILAKVRGQWWLTPDMQAEENTELLLGRLPELIKKFDEQEYFRRVSSDFDELGFGFGRPTLMAQALGVLHKFGKLTPELKNRLQVMLAADMAGGIWRSTIETGQVILNTSDILADDAKAMAAEAASGRKLSILRPDGSTFVNLSPVPAGFTATYTQTAGKVDPLPAVSAVTLSGVKKGETVTARLTGLVPYTSVEPQSQGISVHRKLLKITASGSLELYANEPVKVGDVVVSEVAIERDGAKFRDTFSSQFVVVEDGIPSFALGVEDERPYLADAKVAPDAPNFWASVVDTQRFPDHVTRVVKLAPGGSIRLYQVWRAAFAGNASLPPASAFDMYSESMRGNTVAGKVESRP